MCVRMCVCGGGRLRTFKGSLEGMGHCVCEYAVNHRCTLFTDTHERNRKTARPKTFTQRTAWCWLQRYGACAVRCARGAPRAQGPRTRCVAVVWRTA